MQDASHKDSPDFLISSNVADRLWAQWIAWQLQDAKYAVVFPEWNFRPGFNIILETQKALEDSERVLLVLSPDYLKILATDPVWAAAFFQDQSGQKGKLLPVRVRKCDPTGLLGPIIYIDLVGLDESSSRDALLAGVSRNRVIPTAPPVFPGGIQEMMVKQPHFPGYRPPIWNIPRYNPFFTDREDMLERLHEALKEGTIGLVHSQVISGLGGMGKTQLAVAYAYLYSHNYEAGLWVDASERKTLVFDTIRIAKLLKLNIPEEEKQDESKNIGAVKQWLEDHSNWLLILDNIEDLKIAEDFIPSVGNGHVLFTARTQATGTMASTIRLDRMKLEDGAVFLLRRAKIIGLEATLNHTSDLNRSRALEISLVMGSLPLALDQAGAYVEETENDLSGYLELYRRFRLTLLARRGEVVLDHPEPVATTWLHSFEIVQHINSVAYELLIFCAFLAPDAIPEEILIKGALELGPVLGQFATDPLQKDNVLALLRKYSLLQRDTTARTFSVHRLVQAVLRDKMSQEMQRLWATRAILAVHRAFLDPEALQTDTDAWQHCQRYFMHVQTCAHLIEKFDLVFTEAAQLLHQMGYYLQKHLPVTLTEMPLALDLPPWRDTMSAGGFHVAKELENYVVLLQKMKMNREAVELKSFVDSIESRSSKKSQT